MIFNTKLLHQGGVINFQYPKIAMFFAFGVRNEHTYNQFEFMKNYKKKSNMQTKYWYEEKDYPLEFKNLLASKGLLLEG